MLQEKQQKLLNRYKVDPDKAYTDITVQGPISRLARTNDRYLPAKVKSRLLVASGVPAGKVKVVTENGSYPMRSSSGWRAMVAEVQKSFGVQKS